MNKSTNLSTDSLDNDWASETVFKILKQNVRAYSDKRTIDLLLLMVLVVVVRDVSFEFVDK